MVNLLGDKPIAEIRKRDGQDYMQRMARLPKRWRQKNRGKTASQLLAEIDGKDIERVSPATVNKEAGLVKAFWTWAVTREELPSNAMDAAQPMDIGNTKDKRRPFTDADLELIAPVVAAERKGSAPERFWITSLLAHTGARLEEMGQLRKSDVVTIDCIPCLRITDEAGSLKNSASERLVPIHSALIRKGFLKYVDGRPDGHLWSNELKATKRTGQPVSKWFARQLTKLGIPDRAKKGLHSFRHTVRDQLLRAKVDPVVRREILGHAHEDIEDKVYGDPVDVATKKEAIEKLNIAI
jgi:integrase